MTTPRAVLLFAAGLGTRMAPLTDTMPKPMVPVAGRPLLDHARAQCDGLRTVVNVHYRATQIIDHLHGTDTGISDERDALLETGGGLKRALPLLGSGPVFTLNTDAVWTGPSPLQTLRHAWAPDAMEGLLLMIPRDRATGHRGTGDFDIAPDGRITRGSDYVYSGAQIITTDRFAAIADPAFSMWALWSPMLEAGTLYGTPHPGGWCDVGTPQSIPLAETLLKDAAHV